MYAKTTKRTNGKVTEATLREQRKSGMTNGTGGSWGNLGTQEGQREGASVDRHQQKTLEGTEGKADRAGNKITSVQGNAGGA